MWDLYYCKSPDFKAGDDELIQNILEKMQAIGFTTREISSDRLEEMMVNIPAIARFCSRELVDLKVDCLFVPKPEFFERLIAKLTAEGN
jgi:Flp pilus assembly CpaF family ATPase